MAAVPVGNICDLKKEKTFYFASLLFLGICLLSSRFASIRPSLYPFKAIVFCFLQNCIVLIIGAFRFLSLLI
jgi:hypothetical protein